MAGMYRYFDLETFKYVLYTLVFKPVPLHNRTTISRDMVTIHYINVQLCISGGTIVLYGIMA